MHVFSDVLKVAAKWGESIMLQSYWDRDKR